MQSLDLTIDCHPYIYYFVLYKYFKETLYKFYLLNFLARRVSQIGSLKVFGI